MNSQLENNAARRQGIVAMFEIKTFVRTQRLSQLRHLYGMRSLKADELARSVAIFASP